MIYQPISDNTYNEAPTQGFDADWTHSSDLEELETEGVVDIDFSSYESLVPWLTRDDKQAEARMFRSLDEDLRQACLRVAVESNGTGIYDVIHLAFEEQKKRNLEF